MLSYSWKLGYSSVLLKFLEFTWKVLQARVSIHGPGRSLLSLEGQPLWPREAQGGRERTKRPDQLRRTLAEIYPSWDRILAADQGFLGTFRVGQTKHFKVKTSVFRIMCTLSTPLGFLAKSLFFQKGVGVRTKAVAAGRKWLWERKVCPGLFLQGHLEFLRDTWFTAFRSRMLAEYIGEVMRRLALSIFSSLWGWRQMGWTPPPEKQANKYSHSSSVPQDMCQIYLNK